CADGRSIIIVVPLLPAPAAAAPVAPEAVPAAPVAPPTAEAPVLPPQLAPGEVEALAVASLDEARRAMAANDLTTAINRLNRVLGLPANSLSEVAQALIGEARERNGEIAKARAEYELYLKLFPNGAAVARVRDHLAALPAAEAPGRARARPLPKEAGPAEWTIFGNLAAYHYLGNSQIQTDLPAPPGQVAIIRDTLSLVDQNSLITSVNANARRRDAFSDTRIVFRDTNNRNFLTPTRSYNRVYSAYVDHNDRHAGYYVRAGRQNPNGLGVMERFDGVQVGYNVSPKWRGNVVVGDAVEFGSPYKKIFAGASIDLLPETGTPGLTVYAVEQKLDGNANRRALGAETRYFDGHATAYGSVDYDVLYKGINIATLQGNYLDAAGNNYFFVLDHRRAPSFALTNALPGAPGLTLQDLVALQGLRQLRDQATALTAKSNMIALGLTRALSENWQIGADYRLSSISATQAVVATLPLAVIGTCLGVVDPVNETCVYNTAEQQGSGNNHVLTFQGVGNNLFFSNAVGVGSVSLISAPTFSGVALGGNYVLPFAEHWRFDASLRYYTQKDNAGGTQQRLSPSAKLTYEWRNQLYLEIETGYEVARSKSETQADRTQRSYVYSGLRYDFR
ncbi:MAG: tetratricopeptide repeat protein, partial [Rhodocyclales bacterium]|nr:tetratricopeptide repeat protein [Rhodocyclales bacterium]